MTSPDGHPTHGDEHAVFLTGATGYLGAFLLEELLRTSEAEVYCLARGADAEEAMGRIEDVLRGYRIWDDDLAARIVPVPGDLAKPLLGMPEEQFERLSTVADVVYHAGALVNFVFPYSALKAANVLGTREVVRLAVRGRVKPLHHISSLDVMVSGDEIDVREDDPLPAVCNGSGYIQSKYVAEQVVSLAGERGLPITIFRPWLVGGHSETGVCHLTDYTLRVLKACVDVGIAPNHDETVAFSPVDFFAKAVVHIARKERCRGRAFHFAHPEPVLVSDILDWVESFGYELERLDYADWRRELIRRLPPGHPCYSILPLIPEDGRPYGRRFPKFDATNTFTAVADRGITCPRIEEALVHRYLSYLNDIDFLDAPASRRMALTVGEVQRR
jgi:myxalamid-type nonribosomal peptide synthetase MxaA